MGKWAVYEPYERSLPDGVMRVSAWFSTREEAEEELKKHDTRVGHGNERAFVAVTLDGRHFEDNEGLHYVMLDETIGCFMIWGEGKSYAEAEQDLREKLGDLGEDPNTFLNISEVKRDKRERRW